MRRILLVALGALSACAAGSAPEPNTAEPNAAEPKTAVGFGAGTTSYLEPSAVGSSSASGTTEVAVAEDPAIASMLSRPTEAAFRSSAATAPVTADDGDTLRQRERALRDSLRGSERVMAALDLAALLCELERHREAVGLLDRMSTETRDPVLAVALAGVQRDLGQRHLAVAGLRALRREQGVLSLHPGLLFELAELEWLEGEGESARQTLAELRRAHADDAWSRQHRQRIEAFENELETRTAPGRVSMRDLLGNLRGAPSSQVRLSTFEELLAIVRQPNSPSAVRALERRVLAIGAGDESAAVRARTVQAGPLQSTQPGDGVVIAFLTAALADAAPFVRRVAVRRAVELLTDAAAPLLLARLAEEQDAETFRVLHAALAELVGDTTTVADFDASDAKTRIEIVTAWRARGRDLRWQE